MIRTILAAALLVPALAQADSHTTQCSHPSGGSGGGDGGTWGPGGSNGQTRYVTDDPRYPVRTPRRYQEPEPDCTSETADIEGYRRCTKFGEWGMSKKLPSIHIELGMNMRHFNSGLGDSLQTVQHGSESFQYRIVMPNGVRHIDSAMTSDMRLGVSITPHIYTALDVELGGLSTPEATTEMMTTGTYGSPNIAQGTDMMITTAGVVGVRGTTRGGALGVEVAGGARSVRYNFDSTYHDCATTTTITTTDAIVEARARGELWLGPWLTAGATLGTSMISRGDWLAGVYLGVHTHAFDGSR